jgi:chromosomal replication initiator protein
MDSLNDIWNQVLEKLKDSLTPTAMNAWFSDCRPEELTDSTLILVTSTDFKRDILISKFKEPIEAALTDLFSSPIQVQIMTKDENMAYHESRDLELENTAFPEMAEYTFDRFIVGTSNRFAHAAAIAVSNNPGKVYNPLFIYGNSGLGKTHLLLSIGHAIHDSHPDFNIEYVKGDEFTNFLISAIRDGTTEQFHNRFRNVDLFLVDDIQFIAGKRQTQDEFFHTFNKIYEAGHQIVITSDRPPMEMATLDDRLRTRFEGGLMADIQPPDLETRIVIVRTKAAQLGLLLSDDAVSYIAENITTNIRQIEGVIKKLTAYKEILNDTINIDSVKRAIKDITRLGNYIPTPDAIIRETANYYQLKESDIRGQNRSKNISTARQISMYLIRTLTNLSLNDIGAEYENRNHSTVLSSIRRIEDLIKTDSETAAVVRDITSNINSAL